MNETSFLLISITSLYQMSLTPFVYHHHFQKLVVVLELLDFSLVLGEEDLKRIMFFPSRYSQCHSAGHNRRICPEIIQMELPAENQVED